MYKYIALDTEAGGLMLDNSLLTVYFGVFDEKFTLVRDLYLKVKPDDGVYHVTAEAMAINKINLVEHDKVAMPYKQAKTVLYEFLYKCFVHGDGPQDRDFKHEKLTPVGHGLNFDLNMVKHYLISRGSWENFVSYRTLDTSIIIQFLRAAGVFPNNVSGSLESLVTYFGLPSLGELHDAKIDTLQTVSVLGQLLKMITPITEIQACPS